MKVQKLLTVSFPSIIKTSNEITENSIKVPTEGKEVAFDTFEILCGSPKQWDDKFNKNRNVAGGKSATGENFYVCQADDGTSKTPGTYKESTESCCIPYYGKEFCHKDKIVFLVNDC